MLAWAPIAFARYLVFLIAGILVHIYADKNLGGAPYWFASAAAAYLVLWVLLSRSQNKGYQTMLGALGLCSVFLFGMALTQLRTHKFQEAHLLELKQPYTHYRGKIDSYLITKPATYKAELLITHVLSGNEWLPVTARIQATLPRNSQTAQLRYGDVLVVQGMPQKLKPPANPGEFDYRQYLQFHNIYHQHFIRVGSFAVAGYEPDNLVVSLAFRIRRNLDQILQQYLPGRQEYGLAKALVLGIKDELDNDVKRAYANAGAMHVLAVSGLHVGLIFGFLQLFFRSKRKGGTSEFVSSLICILIIWLYALVTGFSASVLRAVVMFSFLSIGKLLRRQNAVYNSLAVSAFCLLLYNPYFIMEVGFQLSYLAVLGIVYVYPRLSRQFTFGNRIANWAWSITCISIAAQLFTFPLGLLYFHQFPVYFALSNLFIIPAATLVLGSGFLLLFLSIVPVLGFWFGLVLDRVIQFMNQGIFLFESFPSSNLLGVDISVLETWLLYLSIVLVLAFIQLRKLHYFAFATGVAAVFAVLQIQEAVAQQRKGRFTVYTIPKHSAVEVLGANSGVFAADSALLHTPQTLNFFVYRNWWQMDVEQSPSLINLSGADLIATSEILPDGNLLLLRHGYRILLLQHPLSVTFPPAFKADFVVLMNNVKQPLEPLSSVTKGRVILDSSNKPWYVRQKLAEATEAGLEVYAVQELGAFVAPLSLP